MSGKDSHDAEASTVAQPSGDADWASAPTETPSREALAAVGASLVGGENLGRYQLLEKLGAGAMGVVWLARDPKLDRLVAIKVVSPQLSRSPEATTRLLREARAMAKLSHRSVVTVHDAGDVDGQLFLAMERVEGTTLGAILRGRSEDELGDWKRWLAMCIDAGEGLAAAHRAGVLHRDFKPDNVLVDKSGRVCVADFGLAALGPESRVPLGERVVARVPTENGLDLTTTGALLGTPAYMSPEQLRGESCDARADQFSFCVALWEALYGARPFAVSGRGLETLERLLAAIEAGPPPPPAAPGIAPELAGILVRGLAADPAARWPDMDSLLSALNECLAPPADASLPLGRPRLRRRWLAVGIVGSALAAIALTLIVAGNRRESPRPTTQAAVATARRLFEVSLRVQLAVSADGRRLAVGSDRLEIRDLSGELRVQIPNAMHADVSRVEFDGDDLRFSDRMGGHILRWRTKDQDIIEETPILRAAWKGTTVAGELMLAANPPAVLIAQGEREVQRWPLDRPTEVAAVSPNRTRIAYFRYSDRSVATIEVRDIVSGIAFQSAPLPSPTAAAWLNDETLLVGVGALKGPEIHALQINTQGFGDDVVVFSIDRGWFGQIESRGGRTLFVELAPVSRAKFIDRDPLGTRDLDQSSIAAPLAWLSDEEFLTWNRSSGYVERRDPQMRGATKIQLDREPANATIAQQVLIVSLRGDNGRAVEAYSLADGKLLWSHPEGLVHAVRCAGDRAPPCYAVRRSSTHDEIVAIDWQTGALSDHVLRAGDFDDIAVAADGSSLLVAESREVVTMDPAGKVLETTTTPLTNHRSVAFDADGGFLVGGTQTRNNYMVSSYRNGVFTTLAQAENDVLALVRASPDGSRVLVLSRIYKPALYELTIPDGTVPWAKPSRPE